MIADSVPKDIKANLINFFMDAPFKDELLF